MAKHEIERKSRHRWKCRRCGITWECDPEDAPPRDCPQKDWYLERQGGKCYGRPPTPGSPEWKRRYAAWEDHQTREDPD